MGAKGRMDTVYKPCPPELLYLDGAAWDAALSPRRVIRLQAAPAAPGPGVLDAGGRMGRSFAPERQSGANVFDALAAHIAARRKAGAVVLASHSEGARERLRGLLEDHGAGAAEDIATLRDMQAKPNGLYLTIWPLEAGFEAPELTVISEQDVLGDRLVSRKSRRKRAENFLTEAQTLSPGDLIVHVDHGVGRYTGLETITAMGAPHECIALEYAGGDRLFLPVENIELLSRYGHEEGLLDKLGGGAWQAKKAKLKQRIREIADKLIRIAAERQLRRAPEFTAPDGLWDEFLARFPYAETDDQLNAIADVVSDFESGRPMDRLVVGDVGFGKNRSRHARGVHCRHVGGAGGGYRAHHAARAATLQKPSPTGSGAFRSMCGPCRALSLPKRPAPRARGSNKGTVDIVIGTHALLAKSVKFANLGLLVIDEEQHFGVSHKERLKELRSDIHVLTLTATPIPRTLQLSLTGVRDLSIIQTPPVDRLAIRTYVSEFDTLTLREAILREHYRGGQTFFVTPRIADLPELEEFLRTHVPEVSFVTANGQMAAGDLDERMNAFYDGKYDVLLATSIVESGLDIPRANTMIVHRADMFGLAQLYQIRGRVGRSKTRAYCFFDNQAAPAADTAGRAAAEAAGQP